MAWWPWLTFFPLVLLSLHECPCSDILFGFDRYPSWHPQILGSKRELPFGQRVHVSQTKPSSVGNVAFAVCRHGCRALFTTALWSYPQKGKQWSALMLPFAAVGAVTPNELKQAYPNALLSLLLQLTVHWTSHPLWTTAAIWAMNQVVASHQMMKPLTPLLCPQARMMMVMPQVALSTKCWPHCHTTSVSENHPGVLPDYLSVHRKQWHHSEDALEVDINGWLSCAHLVCLGHICATHTEGSDVYGGMSCLDFFLMMFPPHAMQHIVTLTNVQLCKMTSQDDMDIGEFMRFLGLLPLMTWLEFASRCDIWSLDAPLKCLLAQALGWLGMTHICFDAIWSCLCFCINCPLNPRKCQVKRADGCLLITLSSFSMTIMKKLWSFTHYLWGWVAWLMVWHWWRLDQWWHSHVCGTGMQARQWLWDSDCLLWWVQCHNETESGDDGKGKSKREHRPGRRQTEWRHLCAEQACDFMGHQQPSCCGWLAFCLCPNCWRTQQDWILLHRSHEDGNTPIPHAPTAMCATQWQGRPPIVDKPERCSIQARLYGFCLGWQGVVLICVIVLQSLSQSAHC